MQCLKIKKKKKRKKETNKQTKNNNKKKKLCTLMDDVKINLVSLFIFQKSSIDSSSEEGLKPKEMNGTISFENVHFSYPNRKDVKASSGHVVLKMTRQYG